ncbi:MAG: hypothetical protein JKX81_03945 [Arenicella sp.]|nr:hypothetical protein [Arenicella sp.]
MSGLALSAVFLFLLLTPGLLATHRYYTQASYSRSTTPTLSFGVESILAAALLVSLPLHVLWLTAIHYLNLYGLEIGHVDFKEVFDILLGNKFDKNANLYFPFRNALFLKFLSYISSQLLLIWLAVPVFMKLLDRNFEYSKKGALASKGATWYKVFTYIEEVGEYGVDELPNFILIDLTLELGGETYIYSGVLDDYQLTDQGDLHRIILLNASRSQIKGNGILDPVDLPGEYLVLNCDNVQTIVVDYAWLSVDENGGESTPEEEPVASNKSITTYLREKWGQVKSKFQHRLKNAKRSK